MHQFQLENFAMAIASQPIKVGKHGGAVKKTKEVNAKSASVEYEQRVIYTCIILYTIEKI